MRYYLGLVAASGLFALGGCVLLYPSGQYDGTGGAAATSGSGGAGATGASGSMAGPGGMGGGSSLVCGVDVERCDMPCEPSACLQPQWAKRFGNTDDEQRARAVAVAETGGAIVVAGSYTKTGFLFGAASLPGFAAGQEGFVGLLDSNGDSTWADNVSAKVANSSPRDVYGVALTAKSIFVTGSVVPDAASDWDAFVIRYDRNDLNNTTVAWHMFGGAGNDNGVAVATDGLSAYVIGKMTDKGNRPPFNCNGDMVDAVDGMFVMQLNEYGGCAWLRTFAGTEVRPAAVHASSNGAPGIWVTGGFKTSLDLGNGTSLSAGPEFETMFLLEIDSSGSLLTSHKYEGVDAGARVEVQAIDVSADETVYVAGSLMGDTDINPTKTTGKAAFVAAITGSSGMVEWSSLFPSGPGPIDDARATGVAIDDTRLYVSGVFGGAIEIPSVNGPATILEESGAGAPFLARVDRYNAHAVLSFDHFPGGGQSFQTSNVAMAKHPQGGVVLAGGWRKTLDFSTPTQMLTLDEPANNTNGDVFVAKLAP